jgi:hypothetical protein
VPVVGERRGPWDPRLPIANHGRQRCQLPVLNPRGSSAFSDSPIRVRASKGLLGSMELTTHTDMNTFSPHPFAHRRAELVAELHRVGQPRADPGLTLRRKAQDITAYEQALRRIFALVEEVGVE